jgi:hypothetical protein
MVLDSKKVAGETFLLLQGEDGTTFMQKQGWHEVQECTQEMFNMVTQSNALAIVIEATKASCTSMLEAYNKTDVTMSL